MDAHRSRQHELTARAFVFTSASALLALLALACGASETAPPKTSAAASAGARVDAREVLPFRNDDYAGALAEAKKTGRPLFVDAWAPWCHSCMSMRAYVLTDPSLAPLAKDFVWLTVDTEKDDNAPFVSRFTNRVWPTLWVIDAAREAPLLRYEGTATAPELVSLLTTVRSGVTEGGAAAAVAFLKANQAAAKGELADAEKGYREVLAAPDAPDRARAVEALAGLLSARKEHAGCTELAVTESAKLPPGTSRATVLAIGLSCAREAKREGDLRVLVAAAERAAADPDPRTMADDRSALYEELVETKHAQKDEAGARASARTWATFLEREASRAPNKQARAVFDPHRLSAYLAADEPERAVPMLTESERDFPDDYNPPARLARAFLAMKRVDDAQNAVRRAGNRVYGPRSLRVFLLAADIAKERADVAGERAALEQAVAHTARSVLNENQKKLLGEVESRLRKLPAGR